MTTITLPTANPLTAEVDILGVWSTGTFIGMSLGIFFFLWPYRKRIGTPATLLWIYTLISALAIFELEWLPYGGYTRAYQWTAAQVFAEVLLIPLMVMRFGDKLWKFVPYAAIFEMFYVWKGGIGLFQGVYYQGGLLVSWSMDTAFIALCAPFVQGPLGVLCWLTVLFHHGATADLILITQLVVLFIFEKKFRFFFLFAAGAVLLIAQYHTQLTLLGGWDRIRIYKEFMTVWAENPSHFLVGFGPGSFMWLSLEKHQYASPNYLQMHSDWLQNLFELGFIGYVLSAWTYVDALEGARRRPRLLAGVLGIGVFAATYFPERFFLSAIFTTLIIAEALESKKGLVIFD